MNQMKYLTLMAMTTLVITGCGLDPQYKAARIDASNQEVTRIFGKAWSEYRKGMTPSEVYALWHRRPPINAELVFPCSHFHVSGHGANQTLTEYRTLGGFYSPTQGGFRTYTFIYDADLATKQFRLRQWDPLLQDGLYKTATLDNCVFKLENYTMDLTFQEPPPGHF